MSVRLDHLNLTVNNFNESALWYKQVFGFNIVEQGIAKNGLPWGVLRSDDTMLCIYEEKRKPSGHKYDGSNDQFHRIYHFGLRLTDRDAWEKIVRDKELKVQYGGAVDYPFSHSWYIDDPSGHEIEVVIWKNDEVRFLT